MISFKKVTLDVKEILFTHIFNLLFIPIPSPPNLNMGFNRNYCNIFNFLWFGMNVC